MVGPRLEKFGALQQPEEAGGDIDFVTGGDIVLEVAGASFQEA